MAQDTWGVAAWKGRVKRLLALIGITVMMVVLMLGLVVQLPQASVSQTYAASANGKPFVILAEGGNDVSQEDGPITIPPSANYPSWKDAGAAIIKQFNQASTQYAKDTTTAAATVKAAYYGGYVASNMSTVVGQYLGSSMQQTLDRSMQQLLSSMYQGAQSSVITTSIENISKQLTLATTKLDAMHQVASPHDYAVNRATTIAKEREKLQAERKHVNEGKGDRSWTQIAHTMEQILKQVVVKARQGDRRGASDKVNEAYYQYYEKLGFEQNVLNAETGSRVSFVESRFKELRKAAYRGDPVAKIEKQERQLVKLLYEDAALLDGPNHEQKNGFVKFITSAFGQAFTILIREGLEALLVVVAIIAYLIKSGNKHVVKWIYVGVLAGLLASFVLASLFGLLYSGNGPQQEITEGITALLAMLMLLYTSNWMISKGDAREWNAYIRKKTAAALEKVNGGNGGSESAEAATYETGRLEQRIAATGVDENATVTSHSDNATFSAEPATVARSTYEPTSTSDSRVEVKQSKPSRTVRVSMVGIISLAALSFLAVFREGAETVLFLESVYTTTRDPHGIWLGILAAAVVLVFLYLIIRYTSVKIPLKFFFGATSVLMAILVVVFAGGGVHALIEGNVLPGLYLNGWPTQAFLGFYPFVETLVAQIIAFVLVVISFGVAMAKSRALKHQSQDLPVNP